MPRVETAGLPQQTTQVVRQARAQSPGAGAFGEPFAQAARQIGQLVADTQKRISTTRAEEALVQFERDKNQMFFNPDTGYFSKQGRDAFDGASEANETLTNLQNQYMESIEDENARKMFKRASDAHVTRGNVDIMRHAQKGLQAYEVATLEAQVENTVENASLYWNDPDRLRVQVALGEQAIIDSAEMQGLTGEPLNEKLQTYRSSFYRTTIATATANGSAFGKEAMNQYGDRLEGPDKLKLQSAIDKKEKVEKVERDSRTAVDTATSIVSQHDDRSSIIEEVNKIKDPDLRDKTMRESMYQFGLRKQAESEARAAAFESAEGYQSVETFKAENPGQWDLLSSKQQRQLESGKNVSTDWETFSDLMTLPKDKLAKVDPTDHFHQLAPSERSKLISAVKTANNTGGQSERNDSQVGRTRAAQTTEAITILFGEKRKRNKDVQQKVQSFYALLDSETQFREAQKGAKLSSEEYTALLGDLSRTVVKEGVLFYTELDITEIPAEDVTVLSRYLQDNGIPVTSDNLIRAYLQARE